MKRQANEYEAKLEAQRKANEQELKKLTLKLEHYQEIELRMQQTMDNQREDMQKVIDHLKKELRNALGGAGRRKA